MSKSEQNEMDVAGSVDSEELCANSQADAAGRSPSKSITSESPTSELNQLRDIVFGATKADLDLRIDQLQAEMRSGFKAISETLEQYMSEVHLTLKENTSSFDDSLSQMDNHYDDKFAELDKTTGNMQEIIESNNQRSQQQVDDMDKRIDRDLDHLTLEFTQKHNQTIDLLNQMKNELNSSKTDKKTLAKLLATVASNLEIEDES